MESDLLLAQAACQFDGPFSPSNGLHISVVEGQHLAEVAIGSRQLRARRQSLQHLDRCPRYLLGLRETVGHPEEPGQPPKDVALTNPITKASPDLQSLLSRRHRLGELVCDGALMRKTLLKS